MTAYVLLLIVGMGLLVKGADLFVSGASNIAKALKIPPLVIGLTLVSMGTSAPEASVSINGAINSAADLSVGNIVGSNIFNTLFILGLSALSPRINKVLNILEPTILPTLRSAAELIAPLMLTDASGALVPIDTSVNPITSGGILRALAILLAPLTNRSAPFTSSPIPTISNNT